jgi:hypothetical protein
LRAIAGTAVITTASGVWPGESSASAEFSLAPSSAPARRSKRPVSSARRASRKVARSVSVVQLSSGLLLVRTLAHAAA